MPKSKTKKSASSGGSGAGKKAAKGDDDLGLDDDFKDLDLFDEGGEEEDDDF